MFFKLEMSSIKHKRGHVYPVFFISRLLEIIIFNYILSAPIVLSLVLT